MKRYFKRYEGIVLGVLMGSVVSWFINPWFVTIGVIVVSLLLAHLIIFKCESNKG